MLGIECVPKMGFIFCVLTLCSFICNGYSIVPQLKVDALHSSSPLELSTTKSVSPPILVGDKPKMEFPDKSDVSTPIVVGTDPTKGKLPPKVFPSMQDKQSVHPTIVSGPDVANKDTSHDKEDSKLNLTNEKIPDKVNKSGPENATKTDIPQESNEKAKVVEPTAEQEDMLHSKYNGGQDVDELKPVKKASEKDEKKPVVPQKDPKSEVSVSPNLDKKGPKLMNETKTKVGESVLESTSKMMAVSSSVLANTQPKQHGIIEPVKTVVSVILTAVALLCLGAVGLLIWKRIAI